MLETSSRPEPLLSIQDVEKHYPVHKGLLRRKVGSVQALNGVSLDVFPGQTVALVGESGCGKTTTARLVMAAQSASAGSITLATDDGPLAIHNLRGSARKRLWRNVQLIFQDPYTSLNARMTVRQILAEPLRSFGIARGQAADEQIGTLLESVGLSRSAMNRYPHAFSGGQRQRIGIARALAIRPKLVIGDEPVSALDVSVGAQIINLFADLKKEFGLTYLLITHDLSLVRHSADRAAVMYLGRIVEEGGTSDIFAAPRHPYTQALLGAMPQVRTGAEPRERNPIRGEIASARHPPTGCAFHPRCPKATDMCRKQVPPETVVGGSRVACFHPAL